MSEDGGLSQQSNSNKRARVEDDQESDDEEATSGSEVCLVHPKQYTRGRVLINTIA